jgi:orotate phosphoribosyltransferase
MAYDFLNRNKEPRILALGDRQGASTDIGGTAVQIVLPESKGLFIKTYPIDLRPPLEKPHIFTVDPAPLGRAEDDHAKLLAIELEKMCRVMDTVPIFVDFTELDISDSRDMHLLARMIRYVAYLEKPNILWLLGPQDCQTITSIHGFLTNGRFVDQPSSVLPRRLLEEIFVEMGQHDRRICPMLLPSGRILWLGATEDETQYLKHMWNVGAADLDEFEDNSEQALHFALVNRHLISIKKNFTGACNLSLRLGLFECASSLPQVLDEAAEHLIKSINGTIQTEGCYHLPHGQYSNTYIYLKPLLMHPNHVRRIARYLLLKNHFLKMFDQIDIVVGGTHSARRLIMAIAKEIDADVLTIDRYIDRLDESTIKERVAGKRSVIVTEVISSGTFVKRIASRIVDAGCQVQGICCVCDLRQDPSDKINDISVTSLFRYPLEKFNEPSAENAYEVNPISLRPMLLEDERKRTSVTSLMTTEQLVDMVNSSNALVFGHTLLGPTHYTYFVDTKVILDTYAREFYELVLKDISEQLARFQLSRRDLSFLVTAELSNAEEVFPDIIKQDFPDIRWLQVDRVRLLKDGTWQLDRFDPNLVRVQDIQNKVVLVWDDGSNTGGTMMQLLDIIAEFGPRLILAYCLINRLSTIRSSFLCQVTRLKSQSNTVLFFTLNRLVFSDYLGRAS